MSLVSDLSVAVTRKPCGHCSIATGMSLPSVSAIYEKKSYNSLHQEAKSKTAKVSVISVFLGVKGYQLQSLKISWISGPFPDAHVSICFWHAKIAAIAKYGGSVLQSLLFLYLSWVNLMTLLIGRAYHRVVFSADVIYPGNASMILRNSS